MKNFKKVIALIVFLTMLIFNTNTIYSQVKHSNTPSKKAVQKTSTKYASLAIDKKNGFYYGWATDYTDLESAEYNALNECIKKGGNCTIALNFSGAGCGVYKTVEGSGTGYGWGVAKTKEAADAIATKECLLRSDGNVPTNSVWGCNYSNSGALKVIYNATPEIKSVSEQRNTLVNKEQQEKSIAEEKARILQLAKEDCKKVYEQRLAEVKEIDKKRRREYNDEFRTSEDRGGATIKILSSKSFYAEKDLEHVRNSQPCDHLSEDGFIERFNKSEEQYFEKSRNDLAERIKSINANYKDEDPSPAYQAPQLMSITEQMGNLEKIMQDSQKQIAANQAARTANSSTRTPAARKEYDNTANTNSNGYNSKTLTLTTQSESKGNNNNNYDCNAITPTSYFREEKDYSTWTTHNEYELTCVNLNSAKKKLEDYKATIIKFSTSGCIQSQCEVVFEPYNCRKLSNNDYSCTLRYAVISKITHVKQVDKGYSEGVSK